MSPTDPGIAGAAARGSVVTLGTQLIRVLLSLASTVVLARLISPEDFGLLTLALSIVGLAELLRDFGLSNAAIQAHTLTRDQSSNLFWVNSALGLLATVLAWLAAPLVAALYSRDDLTLVIQLLSTMFLWNGIATQLRVKINRELRFFALNACDLIPVAVGLGAAVAAAAAGAGVWALVTQQQVVAFGGLVLAAALARWAPGLPNRRGDIRHLVRFGVHLLGTQLIAFFTKNVDSVALGIARHPGIVGQYDKAYTLMMVPLGQLQAPLTRVVLPTLSRAAANPALFLGYLRKAHLVYCYFFVTMFAVGAAIGQPLVELVLGPGWALAASVFVVLAIGGIFRSVVQIFYWTFLSLGLTAQQFRFFAVTYPLIGLLMVAGVAWGAVGVAVGHSVGYALYWLASAYWLTRLTKLNMWLLVRDFVRVIVSFSLPAALAAGVAALVLHGTIVQVVGGLLAALAAMTLSAAVSSTVRSELSFGLRFVRRGFRRPNERGGDHE
jgi:PST family polysaccharide transporter